MDARGSSPSRPARPRPLNQLRLKLRPEIRCALHESQSTPFFLLEDTLYTKFFRIGQREWAYVSRMDGLRTVEEIAEQCAAELGDQMLPRDQVATLCQWLLQTGLVHCSQLTPSRQGGRRSWGRLRQVLLNPLFIRIPLMNPDRLIERLLPWLGHTLSPAAFAVWCLLVLLGMLVLGWRWREFTAGWQYILAPGNWAALLAGWLGLKLIHELYHGLVCKKYGGAVRQFGLSLIVFSPAAFVDVSSSWAFRSRWQRIFTAAAGMYAEFFVAAVATLVWASSDAPLVRQWCHNLITMASVSTLLFNGNFLMRFDGYYIVADLLDVQNLYAKGRQYVDYGLKRQLLGLDLDDPLGRSWRDYAIRAYGWGTFYWRIVLCIGILIVASRLFHGAGLILALISGVVWFAPPCLRLARLIAGHQAAPPVSRTRLVRLAAASALLVAITLQLPWPGRVAAPAVVQYAPLHVVRVQSAGFVRRVHVTPGQQVKPGDPLVTLDNPELERHLADLDLEIQQSLLRARMLQVDGRVPEMQVENRQREALIERRDQLRRMVDALTLRAPGAGRVVGRQLGSLLGQYVTEGQEILAVGSEGRKEVCAVLPEADIDIVRRALGRWLPISIRGQATRHRGQLVRVEPRAGLQVPHPALASPAGGPLAVTLQPAAAATGGSTSTWQLASPHFIARIALEPSEAIHLRAGQLGWVWLGSGERTVGERLLQWIAPWVESRRRRGARFG